MGYIPDWQRQSAAKNQPQAQTKSPTKFGVVSKPIFHAEKALHSQGTQTPFTRHYADASEGGVGSETDTTNQTDSRNVFQKMGDSISKYAAEGREKVQAQAAADGYDKTDKGLLGGTINYREDADGRKYVQKKDPMSGRMEEQRYYSGDDVKNGFKSLFGGNNAPETLKAKTVSSTDSQESAGNMGSPAKTAMQSSNDSYTPPKPGVFSNVDAAVKSATKVGDDTGITSTTDYSTKTRSNSASKSSSKPVGRKDIPGSDAESFAIKDIGNSPTRRDMGAAGNAAIARANRARDEDAETVRTEQEKLSDRVNRGYYTDKTISDAAAKISAKRNEAWKYTEEAQRLSDRYNKSFPK